jgi:hypothetical protein
MLRKGLDQGLRLAECTPDCVTDDAQRRNQQHQPDSSLGTRTRTGYNHTRGQHQYRNVIIPRIPTANEKQANGKCGYPKRGGQGEGGVILPHAPQPASESQEEQRCEKQKRENAAESYGIALQRHFGALAKFAHVQLQVYGHMR